MSTTKIVMQQANRLPGWAQGIIAVVAVGGIAFGGYKLSQWIKMRELTKGGRVEGRVTDKDLRDFEKSGMKPSFPASQYVTWSNNLQTSFAGCGTSNTTVTDIFNRLKNDVDVMLLNRAYGIRKFDGCNLEFDFGDFEGTLGQALVNELSSSELQLLNKNMSTKGITIQY